MRCRAGGWWALLRCGVLLVLGLIGSHAAQAGVVLGNYGVGGVRQGHAGEHVSLTIDESALSGFEVAQLLFTYDSTILRYEDVGINGLVAASALPLTDANGLATVSLFLTTANPIDGPLQLFTLLFQILDTASPGDTNIAFAFDPSGGFGIADGVYDRQQLAGTITVLPQISAVPIVGTLPLALTALALLALLRRVRRPLQTAIRPSVG